MIPVKKDRLPARDKGRFSNNSIAAGVGWIQIPIRRSHQGPRQRRNPTFKKTPGRVYRPGWVFLPLPMPKTLFSFPGFCPAKDRDLAYECDAVLSCRDPGQLLRCILRKAIPLHFKGGVADARRPGWVGFRYRFADRSRNSAPERNPTFKKTPGRVCRPGCVFLPLPMPKTLFSFPGFCSGKRPGSR
jgi:hypothetical protein